MRISDWSSDVCSSDLKLRILAELRGLDPKDRITPIKAALQMEAAVDGAQVAGQDAPPDQVRGRLYGALLVEHPDSDAGKRSEEHTSELQSLMRISYAVFCLKKKKNA